MLKGIPLKELQSFATQFAEAIELHDSTLGRRFPTVEEPRSLIPLQILNSAS